MQAEPTVRQGGILLDDEQITVTLEAVASREVFELIEAIDVEKWDNCTPFGPDEFADIRAYLDAQEAIAEQLHWGVATEPVQFTASRLRLTEIGQALYEQGAKHLEDFARAGREDQAEDREGWRRAGHRMIDAAAELHEALVEDLDR